MAKKKRFTAASKSVGTTLSAWAVARLTQAASRQETAAMVRCEVCGKNPPTSFSATRARLTGWKFTCECTRDTELYWVLIDDFMVNPARWIHHLAAKEPMDICGFVDAISRYQEAVFKAQDGLKRPS